MERNKGWFCTRAVLANVPLFRVFWCRGTSECTLVPVLGTGNIRMYPRSGFWYRSRGMPTILGVNFGCELLGRPETLEKRGRKIRRRNSLEELSDKLRDKAPAFMTDQRSHSARTPAKLKVTKSNSKVTRVVDPKATKK